MTQERSERLQIEVSSEVLKAIDDFQFSGRYPTRASAVRELLRRGLLAAGEKDLPPQSN